MLVSWRLFCYLVYFASWHFAFWYWGPAVKHWGHAIRSQVLPTPLGLRYQVRLLTRGQITAPPRLLIRMPTGLLLPENRSTNSCPFFQVAPCSFSRRKSSKNWAMDRLSLTMAGGFAPLRSLLRFCNFFLWACLFKLPSAPFFFFFSLVMGRFRFTPCPSLDGRQTFSLAVPCVGSWWFGRQWLPA